MSRNSRGLLGLVILASAILLALAGPSLGFPDPSRADLRARLAAPTWAWFTAGAHPLGTDQLGRDILSRLVVGSRVTLKVAGGAVLAGACFGTLIGIVSGYFRGGFDRTVMRLIDMQQALPTVLLALIIIAALGPSLANLIIVLALTSWVRYARIVRAQVLVLQGREFIEAARAIGAGTSRIILRHILPNVLGAMLVMASLELARVVVLEAGLSFLGLGVQPPAPSWGRMLADGRAYASTAWWIITLPGLALMILVLGVNLLADFLAYRLDSKKREL